MTHLAYIIPSYALGIILPAGLGIAAAYRLSTAKKRLAALDARSRGRDDA